MPHVSNRHQQAPAAAHRLAVNRVIKIAGIFTINSDQRQSAQIQTTALGSRTHRRTELSGLCQHLFRKFAGQSMGMNCYICLHTGCTMITQYPGHMAKGLYIPARLFNQLQQHNLTSACALQLLDRHHDAVTDTRIVRHHKVHAGILVQAPYNILSSPFQHIDNAAFRTAPTICASNTHRYPVTMHDLLHLTV